MIGLRRQQPDHGADAFAAMKGLWGGLGGCVCGCWPAHGEAHAASDRSLRIVGVGDDFKAGNAEVDTLGGLLLGYRGGGLGGIVVGQILLDLAAYRACIHDGSFHSAQQVVGERGELGRRGRVRLHPSAPRAQQEPQNRQRQPRDALRAQRRQAAERGNQRQRDQHQAGPQPKPMGGRDPGCKQPRGMEEGYGAQAGGGGTVEGLSGGGGVGLHCA